MNLEVKFIGSYSSSFNIDCLISQMCELVGRLWEVLSTDSHYQTKLVFVNKFDCASFFTYKVSIELSDRFELSDTIKFCFKKWSIRRFQCPNEKSVGNTSFVWMPGFDWSFFFMWEGMVSDNSNLSDNSILILPVFLNPVTVSFPEKHLLLVIIYICSLVIIVNLLQILFHL